MVLTSTRMVFVFIEPSGKVSFILLFVFSETHSLILCLDTSGFSCRKEPRLIKVDKGASPYCFVQDVLWSIENLKVEWQQLGPIDHLTDVLILLIEHKRLLSKQTVGRDQFHRVVCFTIETAVQLGEEKVNLIRRLLLYCVKLKNLLWRHMSGKSTSHSEKHPY